MKKSIYAILALTVLFASCDSWVENAETPSNTLTRDQLTPAVEETLLDLTTIYRRINENLVELKK